MKPNFSTLVISNIAEAFYKSYKKAGPEESEKRIAYDFLESERAILYRGDDKVVVTPSLIDKLYIDDLAKLLGLKNVLNLSPQNPTEKLSLDCTKDKSFFRKIAEIVSCNPEIDIVPYFATEEFFDLITRLKQKGLRFTTSETFSPNNRFVRDHYNCKVGFRQLWEKTIVGKSKIKIPQGFIVDDLSEAIEAGRWFFDRGKNFVFKYNRGTSGLGIIFYEAKKLPKKQKEFTKYLRERHRDSLWFEENFVVEEAISIDTAMFGGSPNVELKITDDKVNFLYPCAQIINSSNSFFEGIYISKDLVSDKNLKFADITKAGIRYGKALKRLGYRGNFDIDLVIDKKRRIFAVEANLRRTGGTHVYELATYLFGENYLEKVAVMSRENYPVNPKIKSYSDLRKKVKELFFDREKGEGIVISQPGFLKLGVIGFVGFAPGLKKLLGLKKKLEARLSS